ncbi:MULTISPECIES: hypothetical protein [unclassified Epibacterium]|uniref:hypothetical protein n=1 Tax=unclassified Epibacterium TaxID=2639179 RepID=UPI001EF605C1|nr:MULTISPECIES: hypothetical protein [unclassified Epibacterium]MCG7622734.1 hypothetical protein [Epibacterium sp. Ofav1-8]MCG7626484.1 hypothetical protein [Epibacterium sp. MM17-32]
MITPEIVQTVLAVVTVGGVGGIWFRLGGVLRGQAEQEKDIARLDERVTYLEKSFWKGA